MALTRDEFAQVQQLYALIESAKALRDDLEEKEIIIGQSSINDEGVSFSCNPESTIRLHKHFRKDCDNYKAMLVKKSETLIASLEAKISKLITDYK